MTKKTITITKTYTVEEAVKRLIELWDPSMSDLQDKNSEFNKLIDFLEWKGSVEETEYLSGKEIF